MRNQRIQKSKKAEEESRVQHHTIIHHRVRLDGVVLGQLGHLLQLLRLLLPSWGTGAS